MTPKNFMRKKKNLYSLFRDKNISDADYENVKRFGVNLKQK